MVPYLRQAFNDAFTQEKYEHFLRRLNEGYEQPCTFKVAETPVFFDAGLVDALEAAGNAIIQAIMRPDFKAITDRAIPAKWRVAGDEGHPHFLTFDFAVTQGTDGKLAPKLIEIQGFPSLYSFESLVGERYKQCYALPENWDVYFSGLNQESYLALFRKTIIGDCRPEEVVIMDVNAPEQKTAFDFYNTQHYFGTPIVSLHELVQQEAQLFYRKDGELKPIRRIYNRLIFDELEAQPDIFDHVADIRQELDVVWITHPNWFYRISKFTMPFIEGDFIPQTQFVSELKEIPEDLDNYVLKPLFSFAGQGVIIDVKHEDIVSLSDPENWILQQKVEYAPVVQSPEGGVKCEIRLMYLWPDGDALPTLATNLVRLSRGKMIGVRYNMDYNWVGGTIGFMEQPRKA